MHLSVPPPGCHHEVKASDAEPDRELGTSRPKGQLGPGISRGRCSGWVGTKCSGLEGMRQACDGTCGLARVRTSVAVDTAAGARWQRRIGLRLPVEVEPQGQHDARAAVAEDDLRGFARVHRAQYRPRPPDLHLPRARLPGRLLLLPTGCLPGLIGAGRLRIRKLDVGGACVWAYALRGRPASSSRAPSGLKRGNGGLALPS